VNGASPEPDPREFADFCRRTPAGAAEFGPVSGDALRRGERAIAAGERAVAAVLARRGTRRRGRA
jgi:hypothetical protein